MIVVYSGMVDLCKIISRSEVEVSFSCEGICRSPSALITKSLNLKCCSRSSLTQLLSNTSCPKKQMTQEKNPLCRAKSEIPLVVCLTFNKNYTPPQNPQKALRVSGRSFQRTPLFYSCSGELLLLFQFMIRMTCFCWLLVILGFEDLFYWYFLRLYFLNYCKYV